MLDISWLLRLDIICLMILHMRSLLCWLDVSCLVLDVRAGLLYDWSCLNCFHLSCVCFVGLLAYKWAASYPWTHSDSLTNSWAWVHINLRFYSLLTLKRKGSCQISLSVCLSLFVPLCTVPISIVVNCTNISFLRCICLIVVLCIKKLLRTSQHLPTLESTSGSYRSRLGLTTG